MSMRHWWRIYYFENQSDKFDIGKNSENSSKKKKFFEIFFVGSSWKSSIKNFLSTFHIFKKKKKKFFF